ncbi:hypothetical protein MHU86_21512 [Fragilaria crotonensis]|nr:hypothetical protein MHU86_21512 [Fragilaria crotonensis]
MYSTHNFYFNPFITSIALLPVIDRKGIEVQGLSLHKHLHDIVHLTSNYTPHTTNAEPPLPRGLLTVLRYSCVLLTMDDSWTLHSPFYTPSVSALILGRRSQSDYEEEEVSMKMKLNDEEDVDEEDDVDNEDDVDDEDLMTR